MHPSSKCHFNEQIIPNSLPWSAASQKDCLWEITYLLTPFSRVLLEKLTGSQLVKKIPVFYGTRRFTFTTARHLSLSWASSIQSIPPHSTSWRSILILPSFYTWVSQVISFLRFPHQNAVNASPLSHTHYVPHPSHSSWFYDPNNIWWVVQIIKLLIM